MSSSTLTRRRFLQTGAAGVAGLTAGGWSRVYGANEKLRVASVGVGGQGWSDLNGVGWADACRGVGRTTSHFGYAAGLTEAVLLGTVAIRLPGETLRWDAAGLRIPNVPAADALLRKRYRQGWEPAWLE